MTSLFKKFHFFFCSMLAIVFGPGLLYADTDTELVARFLENTPYEPKADLYHSTSSFFLEVRKATNRLGLGDNAFEEPHKAGTVEMLLADDLFLAAVSYLLQNPNQVHACSDLGDFSDLLASCLRDPNSRIPAFPQTLSFPGQIGRVNKHGYFIEYKDAAFVNHHYGESVALLDAQGGLLCSAFLLKNDTLLTAAHCACEPGLEMVHLGRSIDTVDRTSPPQRRVLQPGANFFSKNFCSVYRSGAQANRESLIDIAILQTKRPFNLSSDFRKIDIAELLEATDTLSLFYDERTFFLSAGFGDTDLSDRGGTNNVVIQNDVKLCTKANSSTFLCVPEAELVSTTEDVPISLQTDTCNGDSGGIFVLSNPKLENRLLPIGVISRGIGNGSARCGRGGIYVSLLNRDFQQWITEILQ